MICELSRDETACVAGGMNLEGYRESTNVHVQVREGPFIVEYDYYGRCVAVYWA